VAVQPQSHTIFFSMGQDSRSQRLQRGWETVAADPRIYLTGEVAIEAGARLLHERQLPGPQGRHLFAMLAAEHARAVGHDELAEELWGPAPPAGWATSLKAVTSRVRSALSAAGMAGGELLTGGPGVYRFRLPARGWVDLDAAHVATHTAETRLRAGDLQGAAAEAFVARLITARPLLPGRSGPWVERRRAQLVDLRVRALECAAQARLGLGTPAQAARDARLALEVAPLREPAWRLLMNSLAASGDVASALAAYDRCRAALRETLGVGPSAATRECHSALLTQTE
jgi:DNA-binding SARP family transcriptional activator